VWPLFAWIDTSLLIAVIVAQVIFALTNGFVQGAIPVTLAEMFPTRLRNSAIALGYNITLAIFGGTAPLVATWLIHRTGDLAAPAYYVAATAVVTALATVMLRTHPETGQT
jgi:MHS family proline/betaine transporter-like MFS transporter